MATAAVIPPTTTEESVMKLSPHAPEFYPSSPVAPELHLCIFNDGIPSLVLASEADVTELLHGIPDEALDEQFPPTAEEAAELEAVEEFVEMMASLDFMEESEERARISFDHVQKRWETRRAKGLVGKPHRAKHIVEPTSRGQFAVASGKELVEYQHHAHRMLMKHQKLHQMDIEMRAKHLGSAKGKTVLKQRHGIQQPRKLN